MRPPSQQLLSLLLQANPAELEERYRGREVYRSLRVEPPLAPRLNGVG